jgi:hypothetical protein
MVQKHAALILYGKRIVAIDYNYGLYLHADRVLFSDMLRSTTVVPSPSSIVNCATRKSRREKGPYQQGEGQEAYY